MIWTLVTLPSILVVCGFAFLALVVYVWRRKERRQVRHSPLSQNLIRSPGHSLRQRIEEIGFDIDAYLVVFILIPFLIFTLHVSQSYFGRQSESILRIVTSVSVGCVLTFLAGRKLLKLLSKRKLLVLGFEGELATGEELNQLMLEGCRVFHDVPFRYGNIDHVVVSRSGIFSVNTKVVGKLKETNGVVVDYSDNTVRFPDRTWRIPIAQLETEANWLGRTLTSAVENDVNVEPMIALPGWFIKERIGRGQVCVFNPTKPKKFFVHDRLVYSDEMIQKITHQLELLCRNVEPSYRSKRD
jgi:hypothetical protein